MDVVDALRLHVLGGVFPDGFDLVQATGLDRCILGGDRHPVEGDLLGCIGDTGDVAHIVQAGGPLLAGVDINHLHAAAIRAKIDMVAVQRQILLWIAGGQRVGRRALRQRLFDHVAFDAHDLLLTIHGRAVGFPDLQRTLGRKAHAHVLDDPQRGFVDFFNFFGC